MLTEVRVREHAARCYRVVSWLFARREVRDAVTTHVRLKLIVTYLRSRGYSLRSVQTLPPDDAQAKEGTDLFAR
jgi:hypothetical protein